MNVHSGKDVQEKRKQKREKPKQHVMSISYACVCRAPVQLGRAVPGPLIHALGNSSA